MEGVRVLEDGRVALELEDEAVDVVGAEGSVNGPLVRSSAVLDTGGDIRNGDLGELSLAADEGDLDGVVLVLVGNLPRDGVGAAGRNDLVLERVVNGIEVLGGSLSKSRGGEGHNGHDGGTETHFEWWLVVGGLND